MNKSSQISAPGALEGGMTVVPDAAQVPNQPLGELAAQYGLKNSGQRPTLPAYLASLWQRRHFITAYATARNVSMYTDARLGQIWQVLTPLLNSLVYYLIFGILFEASRGVTHYPAFLVTGVFIFAYTERSIVVGSHVMRANLQLIRALYFPRASLPLAYVMVELQQMLVGFVVLIPIQLASHQYPSWHWLLLFPALGLQSLFNVGAALIVSRLGGSVADVSELIPFILRISRYFCGVMYLIITLPAYLSVWMKQLLSLNPFAVFIQLVRVAMMQSYRTDSAGNLPYNAATCNRFLKDAGGKTLVKMTSNGGYVIPKPGQTSGAHLVANSTLQATCHSIVTNNDLWIAALCWGFGFLIVGVLFFWQAENKYGRG